MALSTSLFEPAPQPVLEAGADWLTAALTGSLAVSLCVLAVALLGFLLMSGRLALQDGARVMLGCFILLGAPMIAAGLMNLAGAAGGYEALAASPVDIAVPAPQLPPAAYDPYAGASLRTD